MASLTVTPAVALLVVGLLLASTPSVRAESGAAINGSVTCSATSQVRRVGMTEMHAWMHACVAVMMHMMTQVVGACCLRAVNAAMYTAGRTRDRHVLHVHVLPRPRVRGAGVGCVQADGEPDRCVAVTGCGGAGRSPHKCPKIVAHAPTVARAQAGRSSRCGHPAWMGKRRSRRTRPASWRA